MENENVQAPEKSIDLVIAELKENVADVLNGSNLPLSVISMILHELSGQVDSTLNYNITQEKQKVK